MAIETRISNEAYKRLALAEPDRTWELWDGILREKPGMTAAHSDVAFYLGHMLASQLDRSQYRVRVDAGAVHRPPATYFVPDVYVIPAAAVATLIPMENVLEMYDQPLPLVVEVWSRSTGNYDLEEKLEVYKQRGDLEIWYFHPYEQSLAAWRRLPNGSYEKSLHREGIVRPVALPGVEIDLAVLFDL